MNISSKLNHLLKKKIQNSEVPGLSLGVANQHEVIYCNAVGVRNIENNEKLQPTHLFHMASVSKPFVATAILQLVEQKKLSLDQTVQSILPYFEMNDPRYKEIKLFQILNHTSGMPDVTDYEWYQPQYDDGAAERYVRSLTSKKLLFSPGEQFAYSNIAFDILGDLIAKVSGLTFEDYMKNNILNKIDMKESNFLMTSINKNLLVSPHIWEEKVKISQYYPYNRRHAPSSTLNSNVIEMSNWIITQLNHGSFNGIHILEKGTHCSSWEITTKIDSFRDMGISWFLENHKGIQVISHSGCDIGFRSHIAIIPKKNLGFIIACNYERASLDPIDDLILEIINILID